MAKASRSKRKRAAVRSAKRSRNNSWWYALTALVVIAGVSLIVYARATAPTAVGPYVADNVNAKNPHNKDSHWHAALGVYDCDNWLGDGSGEGLWNWPAATPHGLARPRQQHERLRRTAQSRRRHHPHGAAGERGSRPPRDGREATSSTAGGSCRRPASISSAQSGRTATSAERPAGHVAVGRRQSGTAAVPRSRRSTRSSTGDPSSFKLDNDDVVMIAFLPPGKTIESIGNPPSLKNLPGAREPRDRTEPDADRDDRAGAPLRRPQQRTKAPTAPTSTP